MNPTPTYVSFGGGASVPAGVPPLMVPPPVSGDVMDLGDITDPQDATVVQPVDVTMPTTPQP
jgi:hypothetical protein